MESDKEITKLLSDLFILRDYDKGHSKYKRICVENAPAIMTWIREKYDLYQSELAELLGVSKSCVSKIENVRSRAGLPVLLKMAELIEKMENEGE